VGDIKLGVDMPKREMEKPNLEASNVVPKDLFDDGVEW